MNNRNSVNETNLVNFSADLSTLNQLDAKDGLLSFPFDHIYACHSQSSDRRQPLQLEKEIEISTHCVSGKEKTSDIAPEITRLTEQITVAENQNKKLKDLLIFHLDLIQQQNELITKRDKLYHALKQENDTLKAQLTRMDRGIGLSPRHMIPTSTVTSGVIKNEVMLNSFTELLLPDKGNSLIFDKSKPCGQGIFGIAKATPDPEAANYKSADIKVPPVLDKKLNCDNFKMIDNKRSLGKKEVKAESRSEALYTVTSNSGNPIIQRIHKNRRRNSNIGSLSRMSKKPKTEVPETSTSRSTTMEQGQSYDRNYTVNKKSKMINTYGKSRNTSTIPKHTTQFTGSLSDRLQLIDTTPTGEDPYQLGEADMREQSPIPKLMLQKTNHGRMKICTDPVGETNTRRIYDMPDGKSKLNRFMSVYEQRKKEDKTMLAEEPDMVKTDPDIGWPNIYNDKPVNETSMCDFSYGDASMLPSLDANEFQELFTSDAALNLDSLNQLDEPPEKMVPDKTIKRRAARTTSLMVPDEEIVETKRGGDSRRGRKRALSTTGLGKQTPQKSQAKPKTVKGRGGAAARGKKSPVPALFTDKPYPTLVGDPDLSWYFGLDPDMKLEDLDPPLFSQASTVEVPRWREKPYTSSYTLEGTENVDDRVFEKRHQKLEAEERRQLRCHMRRIREQRHVEKLRQRQRGSWCTSPVHPPSLYTMWPCPQQDAQYIDLTEELPVNGFGEPVPQLPESGFMLPWVRTSKALKKSKRSKTLH